MYKSYGLFRPLVVFAGTIAILQSLIWIAMSVIAILAYCCVFNFRGIIASLGTITELAIFHMYFHGPCHQSGMPNLDYESINNLNLIKPVQIHICMWIYGGVSILWLISSVTLLINVRYVNLRNANYFLHTWIFLTLTVSIVDLGLGIAFGIDYDTLRHETHRIAVHDNGTTDEPQYLVIAARTAAGIMMTIALRGYTVWLMNVVLCIYFFVQTFKISDYNRIKEAILNPAFTAPNNSMQKKIPRRIPPGEKNDQWLEALHNYSFQANPVERSHSDAYRQNQAAALFEERKRHYEAQQLNYLRYIDKLNGRSSRSQQVANGKVPNGKTNTKKRREITVPDPDYSPNEYGKDSFDRRPPLRSALRTSRY